MEEAISDRVRGHTAARVFLAGALALGLGGAASACGGGKTIEAGSAPVEQPLQPQGEAAPKGIPRLEDLFGNGKIEDYPRLEEAMFAALGRDVWPPGSSLEWRFSELDNGLYINDFAARRELALFFMSRHQGGYDVAAGVFTDPFWQRYQGTDLFGSVFFDGSGQALRIITENAVIGVDLEYNDPQSNDPTAAQRAGRILDLAREFAPFVPDKYK